MAKKRLTSIEEKIARLEALNTIIKSTMSQAEYYENDAKDYLERAEADNKENPESNLEDFWSYTQYLEYSKKAEAYNWIVEQLVNLAE